MNAQIVSILCGLLLVVGIGSMLLGHSAQATPVNKVPTITTKTTTIPHPHILVQADTTKYNVHSNINQHTTAITSACKKSLHNNAKDCTY